MSKKVYLSHLQQRASDLESRIAQDKERLQSGAPEDKVKAAGDLAGLEDRLAEVKAKIAKIEAEPEGAWEGLKTEIEEDVDDLEASFERWVARHSNG